MKPSDYKHIAAWCRVNGMTDGQRRYFQRLASESGQDVDAVYRVTNTTWATMRMVGTRTRMAIEVELNRGKGS